MTHAVPDLPPRRREVRPISPRKPTRPQLADVDTAPLPVPAARPASLLSLEDGIVDSGDGDKSDTAPPADTASAPGADHMLKRIVSAWTHEHRQSPIYYQIYRDEIGRRWPDLARALHAAALELTQLQPAQLDHEQPELTGEDHDHG